MVGGWLAKGSGIDGIEPTAIAPGSYYRRVLPDSEKYAYMGPGPMNKMTQEQSRLPDADRAAHRRAVAEARQRR